MSRRIGCNNNNNNAKMFENCSKRRKNIANPQFASNLVKKQQKQCKMFEN